MRLRLLRTRFAPRLARAIACSALVLPVATSVYASLPSSAPVPAVPTVSTGPAAHTGLELAQQPTGRYGGFTVPDRGLPGRREVGGTRNGSSLFTGTALMGLIPASGFGTTTAAYPTLLVYVPAGAAGYTADLTVLSEEGDQVYATTFELPADQGVMAIALPQNGSMPPLEIGKNYQWMFAIHTNESDRSGDPVAEGWIQRIEPTAALQQQLAATRPIDHPNLYADAGIWYETINALAALRRANPDNPLFAYQWQRIMDAVELRELSDKPVLTDVLQLTQ